MRMTDGEDALRGARPPRETLVAVAALGALAAALAVAALLLAPSRADDSASASAWRGYRALLVESGAAEEKVLARLAAAGMRSAISESTEPVLVSDWSRPVATTLAEARRVLVPGDPRLDAYISRLGTWFEARVDGERYRVVYVPSAGPGTADRIAKAMSGLGVRYILPESGRAAPDSSPRAASFAAACAVMAAAAAFGSLLGRSRAIPRGRAARRPASRALESAALRLSLAAPFAIVAWRGGWASFSAALWGLAMIDAADRIEQLLEELWRGIGLGRALRAIAWRDWPAAAVAASALVAAAAMPAIIPAFAAAVASAAAATAAFAIAGPRSRRRFSPVPIGPRRPRPMAAQSASAILACLAVAAAATASALAGAGAKAAAAPSGIAYPRPAAARGSVAPLPAEALERMRGEADEGSLPGLASWLAHMALQESIPYSRIGEARPDPFAGVSLPSSGGREARLAFDDDWARAAYRSLQARSIEGMLASQGAAVAVASGGRAGAATRNAPPLAPMSGLLYILLLIPPLARIAASISFSRGTASRGLRQEA